MKAEIYTKTNCAFCTRAKDLLQKRGVEYHEYIISPGFGESSATPTQSFVTRDHLLEKVPYAKTVPQIWLEGNYIGGYTELDIFFKKD